MIAGVPDNLAFGRPPICILRLGDFYHCKIAIDNVGVSYEPLVWDLNPEGIGVQPMIATVDLSFKMIGGHSMKGPINKLQNAVSFNFFGNTEVFDDRSDRIAKTGEKAATTDKQGNIIAGGNYDIVKGEGPKKTIASLLEDAQKDGINGDASESTAVDQEALAEKVVETTPPEPTPSGPKITGIKSVSIYRVYNEPAHFTLEIPLLSEGLYIINEDGISEQVLSEEEFKAFAAKGIKFTITPSAGNSSNYRTEEVTTNLNDPTAKSVSICFSLGYSMGDTCSIGGYCIGPVSDGNYDITVHYDGNKVATKTIIIKDADDINTYQ